MKEALINGMCVFLSAVAGYMAGEVLVVILPWGIAATVSGGIITVITAAAALAAVQLHKMTGVYKRAVGRLTEEEK